MLEDLHIGVPVVGPDNHHLGALTRIILSTDGHVTHLVVDPGLIESGHLLTPGGWEQPRERLIPISLLTAADDKRLTLTCDEAAFQRLPLFEQRAYAPADPASASPHPRFNLGDLLHYIAAGAGLGAAPYEPEDSTLHTAEADPPGAADITEGTSVWRLHPHEEIGVVDRVLLSPQTQRVSALVLRRTGLFGKHVLLPLSAIADLQDGIAHVQLDDAALDALQPYTPGHTPGDPA